MVWEVRKEKVVTSTIAKGIRMRETREDQEGVEGRDVQNYILAIAERRQAFLQPVESRCVYTDLFFNPEFKPVNLFLGCSWVVNTGSWAQSGMDSSYSF